MAERRFADLPPAGRAAVVVLGAAQIGLAAAAWTDLARRPAAEVAGDKRRWALRIGLNFCGPLWYFRRGRV